MKRSFHSRIDLYIDSQSTRDPARDLIKPRVPSEPSNSPLNLSSLVKRSNEIKQVQSSSSYSCSCSLGPGYPLSGGLVVFVLSLFDHR